jgi:hypothetical protein
VQYFDIPTIKSSIEALEVISANWLIPAFVFAANDVGKDAFVDMSKRRGTDHFLDQYFNAKLINIEPFDTGNNLLRPRLKGVTWKRGEFAGDYMIRQDTKMWGNLFSSRGYREMRLQGYLEGEKTTIRLTDAFQHAFEAEIPATFQFEDFLVWLFAFSGFSDEINSWQALYDHLLKEQLELQDFQGPYKGRFKLTSSRTWPNTVKTRPTDDEFLNELAPRLSAYLVAPTAVTPELDSTKKRLIGEDDAVLAIIRNAIGKKTSHSFLLAGPPGTGKTKYAHDIADFLTSGDEDRVLFLQFHPKARAIGLGRVPSLDAHIRNYRNGRDLTGTPRGVMVIDLFGLTEVDVRTRFPDVYQHVFDNVKPERDSNRDKDIKSLWWLFGRARSEMRPVLKGLPRYIATVETSKHRFFQFLDGGTLPDNMLIAIGVSDAAALAVLSSRFHVTWALTAGGTLEDRPRYNKSQCFDTFPSPDPTEAQKARLCSLGEQLDAHRKAQQAAHPKLTLTQMYNVLEKLRAGERIEGKDKEIYDQGLVGILRDLHDQIDAAVAEAYGWPATLSDDDILHRLVDLNRERAVEEARGHIRWLRPEYQNPTGHTAAAKDQQTTFDVGPKETTAKTPWPKSLPEQIAAVRAALDDLGEASPEQVARQFHRAQARAVQPLLESLAALGQARTMEGGRFAA